MATYWSQDLFVKAFLFAAKAHYGQNIPGSDIPYIVHIGCVCGELMAVIDNSINGNLVIQCGALHDVIEDTPVTYEDILQEFGLEIANGVHALSKDYSLDKEFQIEDSISRILDQPKEIWMVKIADRISNLSPPPVFWPTVKRFNYLNQSLYIYNSLKDCNSILAERLLTKIEQYKAYI